MRTTRPEPAAGMGLEHFDENEAHAVPLLQQDSPPRETFYLTAPTHRCVGERTVRLELTRYPGRGGRDHRQPMERVGLLLGFGHLPVDHHLQDRRDPRPQPGLGWG